MFDLLRTKEQKLQKEIDRLICKNSILEESNKGLFGIVKILKIEKQQLLEELAAEKNKWKRG